MAPALVEHSAKERNSVSKKYLNNLSYIPRLGDIVLVDKLKRVDSPTLLKNKLFNTTLPLTDNSNQEKENNKSELTQKMPEKSIAPVTNSGDKINCTSLKVEQQEVAKNVHTPNAATTDNDVRNCKSNTTNEERKHPVAKLDVKYVSNLIEQRRGSVFSQFLDLNKNVNSLNRRLRNLQSKNITSHIASRTSKTESNIIKDLSLTNKSQTVTLDKRSLPYDVLGKVSDLACYLEDDNTDSECNFESRVRVPTARGKRKSENPPPTPEALHTWKRKRAKIGSQCSWLSLAIASLDKKIADYHQIHKNLKSERQSKISYSDNIPKLNFDNNDKNGLVSSTSEDFLTHGCSRACPVSKRTQHKYISKSIEHDKSRGYGCRCLSLISPCRLCLQSESIGLNNSSVLAGKLDQSYHTTLSYENDISLSFLLEETLRRQRINTKVTITKSTKKKKKSKLKDTTPIISSEITKPKTESIKTKTQRLRSDEYSRKRSFESSGRSKKSKLSESFNYDSSKPSTPTNELASPLSQSLPSSLSFFSSWKNKKKPSSSGDYDINNIVIPYSIAASTRVERIQYKEIPTPGWRNIDVDTDENEFEEERELTDEEVISDRHARCELQERRRFTSYFQPTRRQRPNRLSEGPLSEPPSPLVPEESQTPVDSPISNAAMLLSKDFIRVSNLTLCTEDERDDPWPLRTFPLCESECKKLNIPPSSNINFSCETTPTISRFLNFPKYPSISSLASESPHNTPRHSPSPLISPGVPNELDKNWTVKLVNDTPTDVVTSEKIRKGIVLKLAKK